MNKKICPGICGLKIYVHCLKKYLETSINKGAEMTHADRMSKWPTQTDVVFIHLDRARQGHWRPTQTDAVMTYPNWRSKTIYLTGAVLKPAQGQ